MMMLTQHRRQSAKLSNIECSLWKCRNGNSEVFFYGINCGLRINEEDSMSCLAKFFLCWNMKLFHTALSPHNSACWNKNYAVYNCAQIFLSVKLAKDRNVIQKFLNHKIQVAQLQAWTHSVSSVVFIIRLNNQSYPTLLSLKMKFYVLILISFFISPHSNFLNYLIPPP